MEINLDNIGRFTTYVTMPRNKLNTEGFELRSITNELIPATSKDLEDLLIEAENQKEKYFRSHCDIIQKIKEFLGK